MFGFRARGRLKGHGRLGQVVVEMILILPVFLTVVFTIMEMGYLAFWIIVLNHATYEAARVGALTAGPDPGMSTSVKANVDQTLDKVIKSVISTASAKGVKATVMPHDRQADQDNYELIVTGSMNLTLVFPISRYLMSSKMACPKGPGAGVCRIETSVRMPIEAPLHK